MFTIMFLSLTLIIFVTIIFIIYEIYIVSPARKSEEKVQKEEKSDDLLFANIIPIGLNQLSCLCPYCSFSTLKSLSMDSKIEKIKCPNCKKEFISFCED